MCFQQNLGNFFAWVFNTYFNLFGTVATAKDSHARKFMWQYMCQFIKRPSNRSIYLIRFRVSVYVACDVRAFTINRQQRYAGVFPLIAEMIPLIPFTLK